MSSLDTPIALPLWQRILFAIPVLGRMAREVAHGEPENVWYALATFLSLWGCAILTFGLPGLYLPALALVPVIWVILILMAGI